MFIPNYTCIFLHEHEFDSLHHCISDIILLTQIYFALFHKIEDKKIALIEKPLFLVATCSSLLLFALEDQLYLESETQEAKNNNIVVLLINACYGLALLVQLAHIWLSKSEQEKQDNKERKVAETVPDDLKNPLSNSASSLDLEDAKENN